MAKEERIENCRYINFTRKEATDFIGLLTAQLADETLIGNQSNACPDFKIYNSAGILTSWTSFIVNAKPKATTYEIFSGCQTIIVFSKHDVAAVIQLLVSQLANVTIPLTSITIFDNDGCELYRLSLNVN
jgi:hypothetical protein